MLYSVAGSQGSGKSTLLDALATLGYKTIQRKSSRSILTDWNVSLSEVNNNRELTLKFQDEILKRKHEDEQEAIHSKDVWFGERSFADLFTYSLVTLGKENENNEWLASYFDTCSKHQMHYKGLFYLTVGHFDIVDDGVRGAGKHYSNMIDLVMFDYTKKMLQPHQRMTIITESSVDDRVARIQKIINKNFTGETQ